MKIEFLQDFLKEDFESKVVQSLAKKVYGSLSLKRNGDVTLVTRLSTYYYALDQPEYSNELLSSIYEKVIFDSNNRTLWGAYVDSILLLAEIQKDTSVSSNIRSIINSQDVISGTRRQYFEEHTKEDYLEDMATARLESQKYRCEIYAGALQEFFYHKHMLKLEDEEYFDTVQEYLNSEIEMCTKLLRDSLLGSRIKRP